PITPAKITTTKSTGAQTATESIKEAKPDAVETDDSGYFTMENVELQVPVRSAVHVMNMKVFQNLLQNKLRKKYLDYNKKGGQKGGKKKE
ncbi:unnamed protein product, partial [Onchocerca ochengi]|uniref:Transposase n=1 Tax=Onchocerca ochengi TaxID=42157 RepID=A0A182ELJ2_ONCOC